jgi:hypothetical protein
VGSSPDVENRISRRRLIVSASEIHPRVVPRQSPYIPWNGN